jgi:hypothetical protein
MAERVYETPLPNGTQVGEVVSPDNCTINSEVTKVILPAGYGLPGIKALDLTVDAAVCRETGILIRPPSNENTSLPIYLYRGANLTRVYKLTVCGEKKCPLRADPSEVKWIDPDPNITFQDTFVINLLKQCPQGRTYIEPKRIVD